MALRGPLGRRTDEKEALGLRDNSTTIVTEPLRRSWQKRARTYDKVGDHWLKMASECAKLDQAKRYADLAFRAHELADKIWFRIGRTEHGKPAKFIAGGLSERPGV